MLLHQDMNHSKGQLAVMGAMSSKSTGQLLIEIPPAISKIRPLADIVSVLMRHGRKALITVHSNTAVDSLLAGTINSAKVPGMDTDGSSQKSSGK